MTVADELRNKMLDNQALTNLRGTKKPMTAKEEEEMK